MDPLGSIWLHFVHSQSYKPIRVHLVPNYHLAGDPLELLQVPLGVPGPHFGNQWPRAVVPKLFWSRYPLGG